MPDPETDALDIRRRRLLFRATHRGTHENDLMVGEFVRAHLLAFDPAELEALETLLETPDTELADWLTGRRPLPPDPPPMLKRIRDSLVTVASSRPGVTRPSAYKAAGDPGQVTPGHDESDPTLDRTAR